jgi:hypothetical protein
MEGEKMGKEISTGKMVWDMLKFQYKPLEKAILSDMADLGLDKQIKQYQALDYGKKILFLDKQAELLRL